MPYLIPGPKSKLYIERLGYSVGNANYIGLYGVIFSDSYGIKLIDIDGNEYLDFFGGASVITFGYKHKELQNIFLEVTKRLHHTCSPYSPSIYQIKLSEALAATHPGNFPKKVLLGVSGSDSIDGAIKAALKYTGKGKIICFKNSYHGSTGLSTHATGFLDTSHLPGASKFIHLDFPDSKELEEDVLSKIISLMEEEEIAAVLLEPILGDGGVKIASERFFGKLQQVCSEYEAIIIVDEIQSGIGRTGKFWSFQNFNLIPDLIVAGKGLSNGYAPLSAVIGKEEIIDALGKAEHVFTFTGHPATCAVALRIVGNVNKEVSIIERKGKYLIENLSKLVAEFPDLVRDVRGLGMMVGVEMDTTKDKTLAAIVGKRCLEHGVYVGFIGVDNEVLRIQPPFIVTHHQIDILVSTLRKVLNEFKQGEIPESTYESYRKYSLGLGNN